MSGDGPEPGRAGVASARAVERCGIREALGDDEVIRRADEIAAAAARYAEASGAANAAVFDETSAPSRSRT